MKFTIITVCYNAEKGIEKTIKSVLNQSYRNYEYIIIDGLSNDGTMQIINEYAPKFKDIGIKVKVVSERDNGIYDAMNKGVSRANGEWINFINAGDVYCSNEVLEQFAVYSSENVDVIAGEIFRVVGYIGIKKSHTDIAELKKRMIFCHQAIFASKELFDEKLFDTDYRICADYDWLLHMYMKNYTFKCVNIPVVNYDMEGVSTRNIELSNAENSRIGKKYGFACESIKGKVTIISNVKYRIYKIIAHNRCLAKLYSCTYGKIRGKVFVE